MLTLAAKSQFHRTDDDTVLLARQQPKRPNARNSHTSSTAPPSRIYVLMLMRAWVLHTYHATTSCPLGVSRTASMLARFFW